MAAYSPSYLSQKISALLDGQVFFDRWRERFGDAQIVGSQVKSFCPFHSGEGFRSFLLDLTAKTFQCAVRTCRAGNGGTFADLHALLTDKPPLEAFLDLCTTFQIERPAQLRQAFAEALADYARQLLREGKIAAAERAAIIALKEDPSNTSLRLLHAEISEATGQHDAARPFYELALEEAMAEGNLAYAEAILDRLQSLGIEKSTYVEQSLKIAEARGNRAQILTYLLEMASRADCPAQQQQRLLEQALSLDPSRPEILEQLGVVYEQTNQTEKTIATWQALAERCRLTGNLSHALNALDHLNRLCPERSDIAEQRANILLALGRTDEAVNAFESLATRAIESNEIDRSESHLRRLCSCRPYEAELHLRLMDLLEKKGKASDAVWVGEQLLARAGHGILPDQHVALIRRLRQWSGKEASYVTHLLTYYASHSDSEVVWQELIRPVTSALEKGNHEDALAYIQQMRSVLVDQAGKWLEVADCLARCGLSAEAAKEYEAAAHQNMHTNADLAEQACVRGLEVYPDHQPLHELLAQLHRARGDQEGLERPEE